MSRPIPAWWPNIEPRFPFGARVEHIDGAHHRCSGGGLGTVVGYEDPDTALVRWSVSADPDPEPVPVDELLEVADLHTVMPRGWTQLVALGPIPPPRDATCRHCINPAVVIHLSGPRCADHPPQPGEWGAGLDWAPPTTARSCAPARCYCSRRCTTANPPPDELATRRARRTG